ncbi:MAG: amidohydrolase [Anaerolineae bacterium]|nr:amidohydrolase [Anaerolineae bacterium]
MFTKAKAMQAQLTDWRRDFHAHPELGFEEIRTSTRVAEELDKMGYRVRRGVGRTGVVADSGFGQPAIAIRADMDALPIQEANEVAYASQNSGVMHACGHDAHTAMALGVAALLSTEQFPGMVRFLFQPSEEVADEEGFSGAMRMIQEGVLEGMDAVIALHVDPTTPVGSIRVDAGPASGGVDSWFGWIIGKGGHGAYPHEVIDPFYISAHIILALNGIVSRRLAPFNPAVVSIGSLHGGSTENVIPTRVDITGTLRYTDVKIQKQIHAEIKRAFELSHSLGGNYELEFEIGVPPMLNHPQVVALIKSVAADLLGPEHVLPMAKELGAEDFSCFSKAIPGAMFDLGALIEGDMRYSHNPRFDIDEGALPVGVAILTETALRFLRQGKQNGQTG